jgi:hypothetical protein
MQVLDLQRGSVHGVSIAPTANISAGLTGIGVDLQTGSLVGHVHLFETNISCDLLVEVQESADDSAGSYATIQSWVLALAGDQGTHVDPSPGTLHLLQFTRSNRFARVKISANSGSITNSRFAAGISSQMASGNGGVDLSPAE